MPCSAIAVRPTRNVLWYLTTQDVQSAHTIDTSAFGTVRQGSSLRRGGDPEKVQEDSDAECEGNRVVRG
jgi:hypothetical protein